MRMRWIGILALAVLCAASPRLFAQNDQITGIAHVAYRVSDLDKEVAFLKKLGYEESFGFTNAAGKTTEVFVKVNDRQFIEVYPQTEPSQPLGWMHVCYESGDINALYSALVARGLDPRPVRKAGAGNLISSLNDPEGRVTEFTQYMPGSRHSLDSGKHLGAHRISDELQGFALPVPDLAAAGKFYTSGLGFQSREMNGGLRVRITSQPYPVIRLTAASADSKPELLFRVPDAAAAAQQLTAAGITFKQRNRRLTVTDPDGNVFVFMQGRAR
jgi:catechol 2,3-dioxygenase-like lactoylglutathione lyase family enzyme